jgi:hypothetical protein
MRLATILIAALVLLWSGPVSAQAWEEYRNTEWRFGTNYPGEPTSEDIEWTSEEDLPIPARKFTVTRGNSTFSVIAADYRDARLTTMLGSEAHTAANYRKLGEVTYDAYMQIDRVPGLQIQLTKPDGRRLFVAIHIHDGFLYVAEAEVPPRAPPPAQFQQSLHFLDENGIRLRYLPTGQRLLSTEHLDVDLEHIPDRALYVEDGFVTPEQYEVLLQHVNE